MTGSSSNSNDMIGKAQDPSQIPWNPDNEIFPKLNELVQVDGQPQNAAWIWGKEDNLGRINLLTPARVQLASREIQTGEVVSLNLPLNEPNPPAFHRESFEHIIKPLASGAFDDKYSLNTQSSTQWDGFRHVAHPSGVFYNGTTQTSIQSSTATSSASTHPAGIQDISSHGIVSRAIFLDYHTWSQTKNNNNNNPASPQTINPFTRDEITLENLFACGQSQGLNLHPAQQGGDIKPGDILLIRTGFTAKYRSTPPEEWSTVAKRPRNHQQWAGLQGDSEALRTWIHDCYFAAVASDAPALEAWPPKDLNHALHTSLLPLWGVLIGEFFDLERLSEVCEREKRWTMFFSSCPPNVRGGVGAWPNALAIL